MLEEVLVNIELKFGKSFVVMPSLNIKESSRSWGAPNCRADVDSTSCSGGHRSKTKKG